MRRREFLALVGSAALARSLSARAQQPDPTWARRSLLCGSARISRSSSHSTDGVDGPFGTALPN